MDKIVPFLIRTPKFQSNVLNALHNKYYSTHLPSSNVHWFYATDIPKSKPKEFNYTQVERPKKFLPFANIDSDALERAYQTWKANNDTPPLVAVNEDKLFDCDLEKMEMSPVYWEGPVYEIRRGLWFQDKIPLPSAISDQIEEGYKKLRPFFKKWEKIQAIEAAKGESSSESEQDSGSESDSGSETPVASNLKLKADIEREANKSKENVSVDSLRASDFKDIVDEVSSSELKPSDKLLVHEITSEINLYEKANKKKWPIKKVSDDEREDKIIVYKDKDTAYISPKSSTLAKLQIEYLPEIPLFLYIGGSKIKRGYHRHVKREEENAKAESMSIKDGEVHSAKEKNAKKNDSGESTKDETGFLSSIVNTFTSDESNEKLQTDLEGDYSNEPSLEQNSGDREIDHVVLAVHGIGQSLSSKFSGMNFVHDCNSTRKLMKKLVIEEQKFNSLLYPDASNSKTSGEEKNSDKNNRFENLNSRTQILPIVWRYNVDFSLDKQWDDLDDDGSYRLPKLDEINVDAVTPIRHLAADVFLDILLYYDPYYKKKILSSVVKLANDIYDKYMERHPDFKGKISLLGHSLGSAICLDILSQQPNNIPKEEFDPEIHLKFEVENFFGMGSPNGVFKFIKRQNVRPREMCKSEVTVAKSVDASVLDESVQSPKINNYYNIFYVTDPVAYRVEPMVHSSLAKYSPINIPYASKNFNSQIQNIGQQFASQSKNKLISSITGGMIEMGDDDKDKDKSQVLEEEIPQNVLDILLKLNKSGRIDYSLPVSIFDIGVSAIASHTQYFDDHDVAGFLLKELFTEKKEIKSLKGKYKKPSS